MSNLNKKIETRNQIACAVIDYLGGTSVTARIFDIKMPSVTGWMSNGIPKARMMYLNAVYPAMMSKIRKQCGEE